MKEVTSLPGADDQPVGGLSPEEVELLGAEGFQMPTYPVTEDTADGVTNDQTEQDGEAGEPQQQEPVDTDAGQPDAGEHPDNLPFLSQDDDAALQELQRLVEEDPKQLIERLRSGTMRLSDYTRKTQEVADQRRMLEQQQQLQQQAQDQFQSQYGQQQAQGSQPPPDGTQQQQQPQQQQAQPQAQPQRLSPAAFNEQFQQEHGREATQADYLQHLVDTSMQTVAQQMRQQTEEMVQQQVEPVQQMVQQRQVAELSQRIDQQYEALCEEFSQAARPEVREELVDVLTRMDSDLASGNELRRAFLFAHPEVVDEARNAALEGRQEQVERRQAEATPPPGNAQATAPGRPASTSYDDIAAAQKNDPSLMGQLANWYRTHVGVGG